MWRPSSPSPSISIRYRPLGDERFTHHGMMQAPKDCMVMSLAQSSAERCHITKIQQDRICASPGSFRLTCRPCSSSTALRRGLGPQKSDPSCSLPTPVTNRDLEAEDAAPWYVCRASASGVTWSDVGRPMGNPARRNTIYWQVGYSCGIVRTGRHPRQGAGGAVVEVGWGLVEGVENRGKFKHQHSVLF